MGNHLSSGAELTLLCIYLTLRSVNVVVRSVNVVVRSVNVVVRSVNVVVRSVNVVVRSVNVIIRIKLCTYKYIWRGLEVAIGEEEATYYLFCF